MSQRACSMAAASPAPMKCSVRRTRLFTKLKRAGRNRVVVYTARSGRLPFPASLLSSSRFHAAHEPLYRLAPSLAGKTRLARNLAEDLR